MADYLRFVKQHVMQYVFPDDNEHIMDINYSYDEDETDLNDMIFTKKDNDYNESNSNN